MALATDYIMIVPKLASGAKAGIESELKTIDGTGAGGAIGGKLAKGLVAAFAAIGIGKMLFDVIAESYEAYADYEQLVGGVETLFKDSAAVVEEYAANAYQTAGLSANEYMETVTSFSASLLQSLGGDTLAAAEYADMAITDMADNANKMGTSMESIQNAYQGFAKQNYTMLDNLKLGYGGTKSEMERLLADAQELSGIEYNIDNLSDVYSAIHVIQTELGITGTTAKEAATTLQGSFAALKSSWQNVLVAFADPNADFSAVFAQMVTSATTLLKNAIPVIGQIATELVTQLPHIVIELTPVLVEAIVNLGMTVLSLLKEWFDNLMAEFGAWVVSIVESIAEWFAGICDAVAQGIDDVVTWWTTLPSRILALLSDLAKQAYDAGLAVVTSFGQGILDNFKNAIDPMAELAQAASGYLPHSPAKVGAFSGKGYPLYSGMAIADSLGEGFLKGIENTKRSFARGMSGLATTINGNTTNTAYNIHMNVTADSSTTIDNLIAQAQRARIAYR